MPIIMSTISKAALSFFIKFCVIYIFIKEEGVIVLCNAVYICKIINR